MSAWVSSHGAGAIRAGNAEFSIAVDEGGSVMRPQNANQLRGSVLFLLPNLPRNAIGLAAVEVDFSSQTARVDELSIQSGGDELFQKKRLRKTESFSLPLHKIEVPNDGKGLALFVTVEFEDIRGQLEFRSTGLKVSMAPVDTGFKFDTGTWNVTQIRQWNQPRAKTEDRIKFSKNFDSVPTVMVSMAEADVSNGGNFRVKVYATNIDLDGFTVHADSWGDTKLYSCGVSWIAIGI
jgi:hypothetical protein